MNGTRLDAKAMIAVIAVIACFGIIAVYAFRNQTPDGFVIAIVSGAISAVLGFYFGHANGTTSALVGAATLLANQATAQVSVQQGQLQAAAIQAARAGQAAAEPAVPMPVPVTPPGGDPHV